MEAEEILDRLESALSKLVADNVRLAKANKHVNVAFLATRMKELNLELERRVETFDRNHIRAQTLIVERVGKLEGKLERLVDRLAKRFKDTEADKLKEPNDGT